MYYPLHSACSHTRLTTHNTDVNINLKLTALTAAETQGLLQIYTNRPWWKGQPTLATLSPSWQVFIWADHENAAEWKANVEVKDRRNSPFADERVVMTVLKAAIWCSMTHTQSCICPQIRFHEPRSVTEKKKIQQSVTLLPNRRPNRIQLYRVARILSHFPSVVSSFVKRTQKLIFESE